ncbi:piezo-type mechanosensitive ion channel component 2-like [Takifugu rubripes]|uniref:piezo-type mechanosensitive ion channel component 2-like n=1 Tax=Takifugu rubripes TaxID=31033 RepID=UPI00114589F1|nr:piezo-type mechanosensitive ion channel component 2-like [Takifugu rubripes]
MSAELAVGVVFRVLLPLTLTAACVVRYNAFSLVYILLLLLLPLLPEPAPSSTAGTSWQKALGQVGLVSLTGSDAGSAVRQVFPDIGVLVVGLLTWRLILRLNVGPHAQTHQEEQRAHGLMLRKILCWR